MTLELPPLPDVIAFLEANGPIAETRVEATTEALVERYPELAGVEVDEITIDGPHGDVPARLYQGEARASAALVWLHGGAWIFGTLDMPEAHWVGLAVAAAGIPVVSVDYRMALNGMHYPVPLDDVVASWLWATEHLDHDPQLFLGGASAGGNLAAGGAMRLRDGEGPAPAGLVLAYPALHGELPPLSPEVQAAVDAAPDDATLFSHRGFRELAVNYVGDDALLTHPYAFAAAGDVTGLSPTYIVNSEHDTLRASSEAFAAQLAAAGVDVVIDLEPGTNHGHLNEPLRPHGGKSLARMIAWMQERDRPGNG